MKRNFQLLKERYLPDLPKALPLIPNEDLTWQDLIKKDAYLKVFLDKEIQVNVEEKVDGSSVAITLLDDQVLVRNKDKILVKGFLSDKPSKKQYAHIWNWVYENIQKFKTLTELQGGCTIYGEWMWMQHGLEYNRLPSWFIAFDVYQHSNSRFLVPQIARELLTKSKFSISPLIHNCRCENYHDYVQLTNGRSAFTDLGNREGVYIKLINAKNEVFRFKLVRPDFVRGALFTDKIAKNKVYKLSNN